MDSVAADASPRLPPRPSGGVRHRDVALISLVAGLISVAAQGFRFGAINNVFHIPIVLDLANENQFREDPFYQSLDRFVSGIYPLLRIVATEENIAILFLVLHTATRVAMLFVLIQLLRLAFRPSWQLCTAYALALGVSPLLSGWTRLGGHELLPNYFTHSAIATMTAVASVVALARGRHVVAGVLGGLTFCVNAFVGVWTSLALGAGLVASERDRPLGAVVRSLFVMAVAFAAAAAPVVIWMVAAGALWADVPGELDFRTYLREYYPYHTFIDVHGPEAYLPLLQVVGLGTAALLGAPRLRAVAGAWAWYLLVLAGGLLLPYVTGSRLLLNLYPLRADALITLLAVGALVPMLTTVPREGEGKVPPIGWVAVIALGAGSLTALAALVASALASRRRWHLLVLLIAFTAVPGLFLTGYVDVWILAIALVAATCLAALGVTTSSPGAFVLAALVLVELAIGGVIAWVFFLLVLPLLAPSAETSRGWTLATVAACLLLVAAAIAGGPGRTAVILLSLSLMAAARWSGWWRSRRLASWVHPRLSGAVVILGLLLISGGYGARAAAGASSFEERRAPQVAIAEWARDSTSAEAIFLVPLSWEEFQWRSRRRVWVDSKMGAAVMWSPTFYRTWISRHREVGELGSLDEALAYACERRIDFVVWEGVRVDLPTIRHTTRGWSVLPTGPDCDSAGAVVAMSKEAYGRGGDRLAAGWPWSRRGWSRTEVQRVLGVLPDPLVSAAAIQARARE